MASTLTKSERRERAYAKYVPIARHIASMFAKKYGRPYHKMLDVAEYALSLELWGRRGFNKAHKTKKSSWLYTVIYFHMTQVITRGLHPCPRYPGSLQVSVREWVPEIPFSSLRTGTALPADPEHKPPRIEQILSELGDEARSLVMVVLSAPAELGEIITDTRAGRDPYGIREAVQAYMIDELDWNSEKVRRVWREVQECLGA